MSVSSSKPWEMVKQDEIRDTPKLTILRAGLHAGDRFNDRAALSIFTVALVYVGLILATGAASARATHRFSYLTMGITISIALVAWMGCFWQWGSDSVMKLKFTKHYRYLGSYVLWSYNTNLGSDCQSVKVFPDRTINLSNCQEIYEAFCGLEGVAKHHAKQLLSQYLIPLSTQLDRFEKLGIGNTVHHTPGGDVYYITFELNDELPEAPVYQQYLATACNELYAYVEPFFDAAYCEAFRESEVQALQLDDAVLATAEGLQAARDSETVRLAGIVEVARLVNASMPPALSQQTTQS